MQNPQIQRINYTIICYQFLYFSALQLQRIPKSQLLTIMNIGFSVMVFRLAVAILSLFGHMSFQFVIQVEGTASIWDMLFTLQRSRVQKTEQNYVGANKASIRIQHMSHILLLCWPSHLTNPDNRAGTYTPSTGRHWKSYVKKWKQIVGNII